MSAPAREAARAILAAAVAAADPREAVRRALVLESDVLRIRASRSPGDAEMWGDERRRTDPEDAGWRNDSDDAPPATFSADVGRSADASLPDDARTAGDSADEVRLDPDGRIWLIGAGKAAAGMALGALDVLGERIAGGTVTTKDGHSLPLPPRIDAWEASHPVPDTRGLAGAVAALEVARAAGPRDVVLCLLSGGASALWPAPPAGVALTDVRAVTDALLRAGASIGELNAVRKHLSRISGGQLARAAYPARVVALAVSDVVRSPLDVIASGPTVADPTTFADALDVLRRYEIDAPPSVAAHLLRGAAGEEDETPKPGDPALAHASTHVIARNRDALHAAAREAERLGWRATIAADDLEGEARTVAPQVAALAWSTHAEGESARLPAAFILGGETTVTVRGAGRGGRNQELALAAAVELDGELGVTIAAMGTDGTDGPTDAAGGIVDGTTVARGRALGLDARDFLDRNDSYEYLRATGDLLITGPTGTNVNDIILVLVESPQL
ncbi:MAG TPA: glycerate kinase [Longimicrobiaceae bacterium]|nr:glycerate kinase [Longimicrobiaceae bacterium]